MYDLDRIMTRAWETYRNGNADFAEALHSSWVTEKETIPESDSPASEAEGESETRYGNEKRSYLKMMDNETVNQMPKNVVVADCQSGNYSVRTDPIWQYDYGIVLQIQGVELPSAYEVHFSNDPLGFSKTQIGDENGVQIPDEYLLTGQMVYAWLFLHEGAEDGETRLSISIPVRRRAMPLDEGPTSGEQSVITQTIAALNQAVSDVEAAAEEVKSLISRILVANATRENINGAYYLVLDKTFREMRTASLCVIKFSAGEWGTGTGVNAIWHVYDIQETPMLIRVSVWNGSEPGLITFEALHDDDYPKMPA